jgi:hypothetical protein
MLIIQALRATIQYKIVIADVKSLAFIGNDSARKMAGYEQKEIAEAFSITTT